MDDEDYDCDLADEDFVHALTQAPKSSKPASSAISRSNRVVAPASDHLVNWAGRGSSHVPGHGKQMAQKQPWVAARNEQAGAQVATELDDIPSDAFDSSPLRTSEPHQRPSQPSGPPARQFQRQGSQSFRQTTLFGHTIHDEEPAQSQIHSNRMFRVDMPPEAASHHALNNEAMKTWVYPTNLGPIRDYQFSIVKNGLFSNTLVALPTGLGKTFIAATVILNFYRWTKSAKIVFVAPTKPLASQQVEACLNVAGIPRSQTTLLTGETPPVQREAEWETKRLFFMTPQTLQNDLGKGYADPKSVVLLVIDEAHRATGDYAYVKVVEFIRRFSKSFRVLALTATPGSKVEGVQEVIDNLGISHIEIRTEESMDIRQYVHSRGIDQVVLEPSDEILHVRDLFGKALKPLLQKLTQQNAYWGRDAMAITTYGLRKQQADWNAGPGRHVNQGLKFMINAVFSILQSVAHAIKLLNFHGIAPFYHNMLDLRSTTEEKGEKGSKYRKQLISDENFQEMMDTIDKWQRTDGFVGHPKITYLCDTLLNHFMDAGEGSNTRAIVFSEYRDSAEAIVRVLNTHKPLISASIFVGQADSKRSDGMKQKQQIETIEKFRTGGFNVLVATSIGEEGLDIGQVDLIVCYDASSSPIRMLQRMGRTGRKRAGNIVLLLMKGREEQKYLEAKDNYEKMQQFICDGSRFTFRHDLSSRIVPRDIKPEVDKRMVEIPIENSQNKSLPEPKKGATRKKPSKKKFHMPDGVETGFMKASAFGRPVGPVTKSKPREPVETDFLAEVPYLGSVLLNEAESDEFDRMYRDLPLGTSAQEEITMPVLTAHPTHQRFLHPIFKVKHGAYTKRCVRLFKKLADAQESMDRYTRPHGDKDTSRYDELPLPAFGEDSNDDENISDVLDFIETSRKRPRATSMFDDEPDPIPKRQKTKPVSRVPQRRRPKSNPFLDDMDEDDEDENDAEDTLDVEELPVAPRRGRGRPKASGGKKRTATRRRNNDNLEEVGDDCTRTSQLYESDGSDSGADLLDFVVDDDVVTSSARRVSTSPTTASTPVSTRSASTKKSQPFYVPVHLTQESDDDLPSMSQLGGTKPTQQKTSRTFVQSSETETGSSHIRRPAAKKKKRPIIEDSDSD